MTRAISPILSAEEAIARLRKAMDAENAARREWRQASQAQGDGTLEQAAQKKAQQARVEVGAARYALRRSRYWEARRAAARDLEHAIQASLEASGYAVTKIQGKRGLDLLVRGHDNAPWRVVIRRAQSA